MKFQKGHKKPPSAGRKKGTPNKIGVTMKENYEAIFSGVGGVPYAVGFLLTHPRAMEKFLTDTLSKLLPLKIGAEDGTRFYLEAIGEGVLDGAAPDERD